MEAYNITEFRFKDKKSGMCCVVYAREEETALEIINIINSNNDVFWSPKKIGYKKAVNSKIPPYELEQEQLNCALEMLERKNNKQCQEKKKQEEENL